jgi:hypothetical protein
VWFNAVRCSMWVLDYSEVRNHRPSGMWAASRNRTREQRSSPSPRAPFALFHTKRGERAGVRGAVVDPRSSGDKGKGSGQRSVVGIPNAVRVKLTQGRSNLTRPWQPATTFRMTGRTSLIAG